MWEPSLIFLCCVFVVSRAQTACPDADTTLQLWTDPKTWQSNGLTVPTKDSVVTIKTGMNVKLDTDLDVTSITIEPNGRLVWDSSRDSRVRTNFIHVKGTMEIGSESCKIMQKVEIVLKGQRDDYPDIPGCGQKFICVTAGGTLELHGKDKLSWTKLDTQMNKLTHTSGQFYSYQETKEAEIDWKEGLRIWVYDDLTTNTDKAPRQKMFFLSGSNGWFTDKALREIDPFIKDIKAGSIVGVALLRKMKGTRDLSNVYSLLESQLGAKRIREVDHDDAYAMITVKGDHGSTMEDLDRTGRTIRRAKVSMTFKDIGRQIDVTSQLQDGNWFGNKVNCGLYSFSAANPKIKLAEQPHGWDVGDKVLFTSTDYDMDQAEIGHVQQCDDCSSPNEIRVSLVPEYVHWSMLDFNVDMRGEIAMLSRNIKIRGEMQNGCPSSNRNCAKWKFDTFGGHIKVLRNFKDVHVEGVELINMGQQTSLGNYPLHFHMCHDMVQNYPIPPYLRKNSIYKTFARCMTIHGSHGATVQDNVCYDNLGHAIFLEDGGEKDTVIDGNLVAVTRKGGLIPADEKPASFWITNPHTTLINNVAAGSEQMGFWVIFPDEPTELSRPEKFMQKDEAKHTKFKEMKNNLAHSNFLSGLFFDGVIHDDLNVEMFGKNAYRPRTMPTDPTNHQAKDDPVYIEKLTCWKNRIFNTWLSGGYIVMKQYSSSDSSRGIEMVRVTDQEQFIEHSVFLGETDNIGEPSSIWNNDLKKNLGYPRSLAAPWDPKMPIQGLTFYNGPTYADNVWFSYFQPTENYTSGAIGFNRQMTHASSAVTGLTGIQFGFVDPDGGNRVYDGDETVPGFSNLDGDKGATFRDEDGSVTMLTSHQQIVKPGRFYTNSLCELRDNWDMAICPFKYAKIDVDIDRASPDRGKTDAIMVRDDEPDHSEILHDKHTADFMAILGGTHSYTLHWSGKIPDTFWVWGHGVEKDQFVRIGICLPVNAKFNLFTWSPQWRPSTDKWKQRSSIEELDQDTVGDSYFFDSSIGMLFIKFINYNARTASTSKSCEGHCPVVKVTVTSGDRSKGDCRHKAYVNPGKYKKPSTGVLKVDKRVLPATSSRPPAGWGAGSQVPFRKAVTPPVTGTWAKWSAFTACSVPCGGGTKTRTRTCVVPVCQGDATETVACNDQACAVPKDGGFSQWGKWTPCTGATCEGKQSRERSCDDPVPENDGKYCTGAVKEERACSVCVAPPA